MEKAIKSLLMLKYSVKKNGRDLRSLQSHKWSPTALALAAEKGFSEDDMNKAYSLGIER